MTKKDLREENAWLWDEIHEFEEAVENLCRENRQLRRENKGLRRANIALGEEVNFRQDKIDRVIRYCECKIREKKGVPAWLREVMAE